MAGALPAFNGKPLWRDEVYTLATATRPWEAMVRHLVVDDAGLAGYYALMHVWLLADQSTAWLRLPGAVAAVLASVLVAAIGVRLHGATAGVSAGVLLALMPVVVEHAQEARPYPLVLAALAAAVLGLLRFRDVPGPGRWVAWAAPALVAAALHPVVGLPALLGIVAAATAWSGSAPRATVLAGAAGPALIGFAVMAIGSQQLRPVGGPILADVVRLRHIVGATALAVCATVLLVVCGVVALRRDRGTLVILVGWMTLPPVALLLYGVGAGHYQPRYVAGAAPAVAVLAGVGLAAVVGLIGRPAPRRGAAGILLLALGAAQLPSLIETRSATFSGDDPRAAAASVAAQALPGDGVVYVGPIARPMFGLYLGPAPRLRDVLLTQAPPAGVDLAGVEVSDGHVERLVDLPARIWILGTLDGAEWTPGPAPARTSLVLEKATGDRAMVSDDEFGRTRVQLWQ
ncbi:hypothetical protein [Pseudonocardia alni]|uniref:hypothetical protein n=1 Tax=Pseudonocardia alni TaxID=33907 RepID=UPI0027AA8E06|nr:hypothetical protein PaSha_17375 [Pseudonocardia alni]